MPHRQAPCPCPVQLALIFDHAWWMPHTACDVFGFVAGTVPLPSPIDCEPPLLPITPRVSGIAQGKGRGRHGGRGHGVGSRWWEGWGDLGRVAQRRGAVSVRMGEGEGLK